MWPLVITVSQSGSGLSVSDVPSYSNALHEKVRGGDYDPSLWKNAKDNIRAVLSACTSVVHYNGGDLFEKSHQSVFIVL